MNALIKQNKKKTNKNKKNKTTNIYNTNGNKMIKKQINCRKQINTNKQK